MFVLTVNCPRIFLLWQRALVIFVLLHPLAADGIRPMLGENQNIEIRVFLLTEISQRTLLMLGEQFLFDISPTEM